MKHGVRVHAFNFYTDEVGNPEVPEKFREPGAKRRLRLKAVAQDDRCCSGAGLVGVIVASDVRMLRTDRRAVRQRHQQKDVKAVRPYQLTKTHRGASVRKLSEEKANAFFTEGVQDEILTDVAKIADLKVISRASVMQYKTGIARNLRKIGEELGVAHVVEGSVQRAANKVRVNAQLIDARTDAHLWAQTYDRDLADVFAIQSEIAKAIADQLQAKLSPNEKKAIEQPPTTDLAAFDLYSRAKSLLLTAGFSATGEPDLRKAIELLDEAVKRDPSFFDAYCQLAYAHEYLYAVTGSDHTPARLALAEAAVQAATRLRPDAAETHLARAQYLYYGLRDYAGALAELEIARRALPNDPRLFELTGYILRRRGQQEEGLRNLRARGGAGPAQLLYSATDRAQLPTIGALCRGDRCAGSRVSDRARQRRNAGHSWTNFTSTGERTPGRSTKQLMQFSRKDRAPSPAPRLPGLLALWPNAIRLLPNERSSRWATINAGARARFS